MTAPQTTPTAGRGRRQTAFGLALLAALTLACASAAVADGWELLGTRQVDHGIDRDEIRIGAREGTLSKLKLRVRERGVHFRDVEVHYANGRVQDVAIRAHVPAGGESHVIDLVGDDRVVEKVVFWYNTRPDRHGRATVELWGR